MSANTNLVVLAGNLTRDPELRYTPGGTAVCKLGLANNQRFNDKEGNKQERVLYVNVTAWEKQAESAGQMLKKGDPVLIEGELLMETWEKDGQKHSALTIRANRVQFLRPPAQGEHRGQQQRQEPQRATGTRAADGPRGNAPAQQRGRF